MTEPPGHVPAPDRQVVPAGARRPGAPASSVGVVREIGIHLHDEVVALLRDRGGSPRGRRSRGPDFAGRSISRIRGSSAARARTMSAVPSGDESSTTRTSTRCGRGQHAVEHPFDRRRLVVGRQDHERAVAVRRAVPGASRTPAPAPRQQRPGRATNARQSQGSQSPSRTYHVRSSEDRMVPRRIAGSEQARLRHDAARWGRRTR